MKMQLEKKCRICGIVKQREEFYICRKWLQSACIQCGYAKKKKKPAKTSRDLPETALMKEIDESRSFDAVYAPLNHKKRGDPAIDATKYMQKKAFISSFANYEEEQD